MENYKVKSLSCHDYLSLGKISHSFFKAYDREGIDRDKLEAMALNVAIGFRCILNENGERAFSSPFLLAKELSPWELERLARLALGEDEKAQNEEEILSLARENGYTELSLNDSF